MDAVAYTSFQKEYMMFNNGTSGEECGLLLSTIPFSVFFSIWMNSVVSKSMLAILEFLVIVLPVILNVTVFSDIHHFILLSLIFLYLTVFLASINITDFRKLLDSKIEREENVITYYRASTNFVSAICILAVDFKVFPRRFAKTESFGFGLMDLGVGFFIFSHGLVEKHKEQKNKFFKICKSSSTLLIFGLLRLAMVKALGYHEHVTEYGIHWNFFFTLAFCKMFIYLINLFSNYQNPLYLFVITGTAHETFLNLGLKNWVLSDASRDSFLSGNREGLISCFGFICIYFAASGVGKAMIQSINLTYKKLLINLIVMSVITWFGSIISFKIIGVSRRIANLGYILWVVSLSLIVLVLFLIIKLSIVVILRKKGGIKNSFTVPSLLQSINANGLFFFILSNLLTGLINILFQTLLLGKFISLIIIISYMSTLCATTHYLFIKRIFLKIL